MTFYVDVYFLVNLSVDLLCFTAASQISGVCRGKWRIISLSILGSLFSCLEIFVSQYKYLNFTISVFFFILILVFCEKEVKTIRRFRFGVYFLLFQILISGAVYYFYELLLRLGFDDLTFTDNKIPNRKLLIFSIVLLTSIGLFKFLRLFLSSNKCEKSVILKSKLFEKEVKYSALVDSGNLLHEPLSGYPVVLVSEKKACELFPNSIIRENITTWEMKYQKRLRVIPCENGKLMYGFMTDKTVIVDEDTDIPIQVIVAIDKEHLKFGGYDAIIPGEVL